MKENLEENIEEFYDEPRDDSERKKILERLKRLENEGFSISEDKIIFPDKREFTINQIERYFINKKFNRIYSSENIEDVMMHNARMYYYYTQEMN